MINSHYTSLIEIEIVKGGFILSYPEEVKAAGKEPFMITVKEVFSSPRKLHNKVKEVIDSLSLVADADAGK